MKTTARMTALAAGITVAALGITGAALADAAPDGVEETMVFLTAEEKLAHDVYTSLGQLYDVAVFDRIAASEATHLESFRGVLQNLGFDDPTLGDAAGSFDDPALQALYDEYTAKGATGLAEAAAVGIAIEKADIEALTDALRLAPDDATRRVIERQIAASQRHLAAFEALADGDAPSPQASGAQRGPQAGGPQAGGNGHCPGNGNGNGNGNGRGNGRG